MERCLGRCVEGGGRCSFVVCEGDLGGERCEGEVVEVGGGAVLATNAFGVGIVGEVHDAAACCFSEGRRKN